MDPSLAARLDLARRIAVDAGREGRRYFAEIDALTIESKGPQDLVSNADRALERMLRAAIAAAFPEDGVIGEEDGRSAGTSGFTWVLDPIDGTANFVAGIPAWCVVAACAKGDDVVIGVIHDPNAGETFWAVAGGGAWLGERRIQVAKAKGLGDGSVGVGHSSRMPPHTAVRAIELLLAGGGMYFRNASGALMLAYVASGRLVGYVESHMNPWDCVAGMLMIAEAGGRVGHVPGAEMLRAGGRVVAGAPAVFGKLAEIAGEAYGRD